MSAGQRGVTLIIALIMLVIIGLASVSVMRSSLNTDMVANNSRVQMLAMQAAQIGLQYCEQEVQKTVSGVPIKAAPAAGSEWWKTFSNWHGSGAVATTVPLSAMASSTSSTVPSIRPQCLAEKSNAFGTSNVLIVTARGFSPDYTRDSSGRTTGGSVVWLQSILKY